ncbi:MAG: hypothetical protein L0Z53_19255 [Acidobacteriales bacterium]|nr:hypothetical protein [Terriglobales bacterium]
MAATNVKAAFGTLLKKGGTTVAEVVNISGPGIAGDTVDATHQESPDNAREFIGTLVDSGEITCDVNFLPGNATQKQFITDIYAKTKASYSIVWIDGPTTWTFDAIPTGFEPTANIDDKLAASITLKLTGKPTFPA